MALTPSETISEVSQARAALTRDIEKELTALRQEIASLAKNVSDYGNARFGKASEQMQGLSEELLKDTKRAVKDMRRQLSGMERQLETNVRQHPVAWSAGAIGFGILAILLALRSQR